MSGIWPGLSQVPWGPAEPAPFLSSHQLHLCPLHLESEASPGVLGPWATSSRASRGPTASFLRMLRGLELRKLSEAAKHADGCCLCSCPFVYLRRTPEAGQFPGSSSTNGWQRFPVLLDPQSNGRFYRSPLPNFGSPGEGESADLCVTHSSLCQSAIDTRTPHNTPSLNSVAHSWLNAAQLTLAGICWGLLEAEGLLGWVTGLRPGSLSSTCVCSGAQD